MTPRERTQAAILIACIVTAAGGFVGYKFVYSPLRAARAEAATLQKDIDERDKQVKDIQKNAKRLADAKKRSLPADPSMAQREYFAALEMLLREAKVAKGFKIDPKPTDDRTTPVLAAKQPAYKKIAFVVEFKKADLWQVHDFLTGYYKLNLLHQITHLTIKREEESTGTAAGRRASSTSRNDLTVTLTTEGIILDGAEARESLLPVPVAFAAVGGFAGHATLSLTGEVARGIVPTQTSPVLATKPRDYTWLVFKDMFHGPYPKPEPLAVAKIDDVPVKVGEKIPPVKVGYTYDSVINKTVTLTAMSDSPLFPAGSLKFDGRGNLTLTPATDDPGEARVVVTATDANGKKVDRSFKVSVTVPTEAVKTDISQAIILALVTPRSDGTATALIRDNANKTKYEIEAGPRGAKVDKFWYAGGNKKRDLDYEDRNLLVISDDWSATTRKFQIVGVDYDGLIVAEKGEPKPDPRAAAKGAKAASPRKAAPPPNNLSAVVGFAAATANPGGPQTLYRWTAGKTLKNLTPLPADEAKRILQRFAENGPTATVASGGE